MVDHILEFTSTNGRTSYLSFRSRKRAYTIANVLARTNDTNRKDLEVVKHYWNTLKETLNKIQHYHTTILIGDFNAQVGKEHKYRRILSGYAASRRTIPH